MLPRGSAGFSSRAEGGKSISRPPLLLLGETVFREKRERFGLLPEDRLRHLWLLGKTGTGKSTVLQNLVAQDLTARAGCALLDPHGALVSAVEEMVPVSREQEVIRFSPGTTQGSLAFNVFRMSAERRHSLPLVTSHIISVFKKHWADSWGPRLEHVLRNAILAVGEDKEATLVLLYRFLTDQGLRQTMVRKIRDEMVRHFWATEFVGYGPRLQAEALAPVLNKLGAFVSHPVIRRIVDQEQSDLDLVRIMNRGDVLLVNLATGVIGEDAAHLLGGLLLTSLQLAAMGRGQTRPMFTIYTDEFQHFVTESLGTMLAESRKYGLALVCAHQYLDQLALSLRAAMLGNVGSMICFRLGAEDATALEPEFFPPFTAKDLQTLPNYRVAVKLLARGQALDPFSARTLTRP